MGTACHLISRPCLRPRPGHGRWPLSTVIMSDLTSSPASSSEVAGPPRHNFKRQASNSSTTLSSTTTLSHTSTASTFFTTSTTNSTITTPPTPTATSSEPCEAKTCGTYTKYSCSGPLGNCACGKDSSGKSFCFQNDDCANETSCPQGTACPSGFACLVGSCCGVNKCVRVASGSNCQNASAARFMFRAVDGKEMSYVKRRGCSNSDGYGCK
jgi:hypothetical protein